MRIYDNRIMCDADCDRTSKLGDATWSLGEKHLCPVHRAPNVSVENGSLENHAKPLSGIGAALGAMLSPKTLEKVLHDYACRPPARRIHQIAPTRIRAFLLPLGEAVLKPGHFYSFDARPQLMFRGEKIIAAGDLCDVVLKSLFVGNRSQLPMTVDGTPLMLFTESVLHSGHKFDTCDPALGITATIENKGDVDKRVALAIIGKVCA